MEKNWWYIIILFIAGLSIIILNQDNVNLAPSLEPINTIPAPFIDITSQVEVTSGVKTVLYIYDDNTNSEYELTNYEVGIRDEGSGSVSLASFDYLVDHTGIEYLGFSEFGWDTSSDVLIGNAYTMIVTMTNNKGEIGVSEFPFNAINPPPTPNINPNTNPSIGSGNPGGTTGAGVCSCQDMDVKYADDNSISADGTPSFKFSPEHSCPETTPGGSKVLGPGWEITAVIPPRANFHLADKFSIRACVEVHAVEGPIPNSELTFDRSLCKFSQTAKGSFTRVWDDDSGNPVRVCPHYKTSGDAADHKLSYGECPDPMLPNIPGRFPQWFGEEQKGPLSRFPDDYNSGNKDKIDMGGGYLRLERTGNIIHSIDAPGVQNQEIHPNTFITAYGKRVVNSRTWRSWPGGEHKTLKSFSSVQDFITKLEGQGPGSQNCECHWTVTHSVNFDGGNGFPSKGTDENPNPKTRVTSTCKTYS